MLSNRGRPRFVAQIVATDLALPYLYSFYQACETFHYRDVMALSRALGVHPRTIEAWKYREKRPSFEKMLEVIAWDKAGRPMKLEQSSQAARHNSLL